MNPSGEIRASSIVKVTVLSPSHATKRELPAPPCAYTVVAAPSILEVFRVSK